jgi:hypothetical protein
LKSLFSCIIMSVVLYVLRSLTIFLTLPLGCFIYVGVLYKIGGLKKEWVREVIGGVF